MSREQSFDYARDDFHYPKFIQKLMEKALNAVIRKVKEMEVTFKTFSRIRQVLAVLSILTLLPGFYLISGLLLGIWLFMDQVNLKLFVDRSETASRLRHFYEEIPFIFGLAIHMWIQGHFFTGLAAVIGIVGFYLLTNVQMKYDLEMIQLPRLYFLRWDRLGILFLFIVLGAWPGERGYLFVILLAWFLAALTFYDYIWTIIQLAKKRV